jgi:competence protein ComEC
MAQRGRARGLVAAWPAGIAAWRGALAPWGLRLPGAGHALTAQVARWLAAEAEAGRLMPWLPVAFATGIALYFSAGHEPSLWASAALAVALAAVTVLVRARPVACPLLLGLTAVAAGFAVATLRSSLVAHPVLHHVAGSVELAGFVEVREERERSDRIVLRVERIEARRLDAAPDRVRVSVRKGLAPAVGAFVTLKARLNPPLAPLRPGGYDFARDLWFRGIGAIGFALGEIKIADPPRPQGAWLRYAAIVDGMRDAIDRRIRAAVPGDAGAIASALITGKRDAISAPVNEAMYVSSLAHVLSISGYHMAVVAGVVFFVVRGLLALVPALALGHPIKKWAALAALLAATFYLMLSGAEVATQRSYCMIAIVLAGVLVDRTALTLRTIAVAAILVLMLTPESVVHPSFQMSFAATLALIAAYERGLPWPAANADTSFGARMALWGGREIAALLFASLIAGLATTPYAAYHFHRAAPYGVLANLLAMPVISAFVMPAGMIALIVMPFGFDALIWRLMGNGIDWMNAVALWVAGLPGAVGRIPAFGTGPLIICTAGLVLLCLLRTPLRFAGAALIALAVMLALNTPKPDVLVAPSGDLIAVRTAGGRLAIVKRGGDAFAIKDWLAADADARTPNDASLAEGVSCDAIGCIARLGDGTVVALPTTAAALIEDCAEAALVITSRTAPPQCAATVLDRKLRGEVGALALRRIGTGWEIVAARPAGEERPWSGRAGGAATAGGAAGAGGGTGGAAGNAGESGAPKPGARDATPRPEDVAPD